MFNFPEFFEILDENLKYVLKNNGTSNGRCIFFNWNQLVLLYSGNFLTFCLMKKCGRKIFFFEISPHKFRCFQKSNSRASPLYSWLMNRRLFMSCRIRERRGARPPPPVSHVRKKLSPWASTGWLVLSESPSVFSNSISQLASSNGLSMASKQKVWGTPYQGCIIHIVCCFVGALEVNPPTLQNGIISSPLNDVRLFAFARISLCSDVRWAGHGGNRQHRPCHGWHAGAYDDRPRPRDHRHDPRLAQGMAQVTTASERSTIKFKTKFSQNKSNLIKLIQIL